MIDYTNYTIDEVQGVVCFDVVKTELKEGIYTKTILATFDDLDDAEEYVKKLEKRRS